MPILFPGKSSPSIKREQVRLLYQQGRAIMLFGILTAIIAVVLFWNVSEHNELLLWLCTMVFISFVRLAVNVHFSRISKYDFNADIWGNIYILGTFISGIVWGSFALFYEPTWPMPYQVMLFIIYSGLIGGAFNTNSSVFLAFPAFYLPPVVSLMYVMLKQTGEGYIELAMLFAIYITLMHTSSVRLYNHLIHTLEVQFDNQKLARKLALSNKQLTRLAEVDPLTQTHNRRSMDRFLSDEWSTHAQEAKALSLLFIDVDYFKQYNDTYGHGTGDRCLSTIARTLKNNIRTEKDMVARYGGEEFAVILPQTEGNEAYHVAERIMEDIKVLQIEHSGSGIGNRLTASIGISTMVPDSACKASCILEAADKALYTAKHSGRNSIVCAEG